MNFANRSSDTMAMDEEEQEIHNAEEETAEENKLEISSVSCCNESFVSPSLIQICMTPTCERYRGRQDNVCNAENGEQQISSPLSLLGKENKAEAVEVLDRSCCSSCPVSGGSDSDEENNSVLPPEALISTPLSTGKRNSHSKRSANKFIRTYNPQHDLFADCPELNEADGILQWENLEPKNSESHRTPVSTLGRSASKIDSVDNFITPKRITVTPRRNNSRTVKKPCKRNLKVTDVMEANAVKMTNTESLCMLMRGHRVVRDLLRRTGNMRDRKCLKQKYGSPVSGGNVSPGVAGVHPLPKTPAKSTLDDEDINILAAQPTTPILDAYDNDSNCIDELDPTQPSSMLILQDVIAYVEVRSGGDNRSMGVKDQLQRLGAIISDTFSDEVTHVVFKDGLPSTYTRALRKGIPVVSVLWIEACKKAGLRVSERMYPVEDKSTRTTVKPQKKFRKMKSIQPDYDGKVERRKKKGKKDVCQGAEEEGGRCNETAVTPEIKFRELKAIRENVDTSGCLNFLKQCVLPSDLSTDSDCSPDNLRVRKKKAVKNKNVPPVPKWARKSFNGNAVAETLIGVAKIRRKDVEETVSESPDVMVQAGARDSPLAMRLLQKISSPAPGSDSPEKACTSNTDVTGVNNIANTAERYETPKRRTDRGAVRKIMDKGKKQSKVFENAHTSACECSDGLEPNICGTNFPPKHNSKLLETVQEEESATDPNELKRKAEESLSSRKILKVSISEVGETNSLRNCDASRNLCHSLEKSEEQSTSRRVMDSRYKDTGGIKNVTLKTIPCANIPDVLGHKNNIGSEKYYNSVRNLDTRVGKSVEGDTSTLNSPTPLKQQNTSDQLDILKEACPLSNKLIVCDVDDCSLTNNTKELAGIETSLIVTTDKLNSEAKSPKVEIPNPKNRNEVDITNQMSTPVVTTTVFETDEDEFSSSESDAMNPEVDKCIATVTEDLEKAESEWKHHDPAQIQVRENSAATKEPAPKRPLKRKLVPTLDMKSSEPVVVSGITEARFHLTHQWKRRRNSLSEIYGFHINKLSPKSSSEPDMRNVGSSCRDQPRLSDDVALLWKQKKAARKLKTPPMPSLVCTSLHKEDLDLVATVAESLGGFNIDNKVGPLATHVVSGAPRRTLNMLFAIARGLWVLRHDWVLHSLEAGYWLDEEKFEMTEFSPVVMKNRIERQSFGPTFQLDLFSTVGPIFIVNDCSPPKADLEELVQLCGGNIVTAARSAAIVVGGQTRNHAVICVSAKWVLDSITVGSLQPFLEYDITKAQS